MLKKRLRNEKRRRACVVAERRDYCLAEVFEAECGSREVVMIQTARYGRMRIGRCVRSEIYTYTLAWTTYNSIAARKKVKVAHTRLPSVGFRS